MIHRNETTISSPTAMPIRLDAALNNRRALWDYAGMTGGALVATLGGGAASLGLAEDVAYRTSGAWLWLLLGALLFAAGVVTFVSALSRYRWYHAFERRILESYAELDMEQRRGGQAQTVMTNVKTYEYGPVIEPAKVFLTAAWLLLYGPSRPSAIQLAGQSLTWRIGSSERELLRFSSEESANRFLALCADAGLIAGRGPRRAGEIVPADIETAMERVGRAMLRAERGGD
jgi:hypothetical protein